MEPQIIKNTYADIYEAVSSISDEALLLIANRMHFHGNLEVMANTKEMYRETSAYDMMVMFYDGDGFDHGDMYLVRHIHTEELDSDCYTTDDLIEEMGRMEIANFIDDNNGFEDMIFLEGNRFQLITDQEL